MNMVAYFDELGRYVWVGSLTIVKPGQPAPPPHPFANAFGVYEGAVNQATQYHDLVTGQPADMPSKPSALHVFDWTAKAWVDPRTLQDRKDAKWAEIKGLRDALEATSFPYMGKVIDSDARSAQRITTAVQSANAAQSAGVAFSISWTCADNSTLTLDGPAMLGMPVALAGYANGLHEHARIVRAQIEAAATLDELNLITWEANA